MPLNPNETDTGYLMGRLFALVERRNLTSGRADKRFDAVIQRPQSGLALIAEDLACHPDQDEIASIMDLIPATGLPNGPVPIDRQMSFWLGYYHQKSAEAVAWTLDPETLRRVGEALFGSTWQTEMARTLKWGAGGEGDSARVREVLSRRRRLPAGIVAELLALLRQRSAETKAIADEIDAAARFVVVPRNEDARALVDAPASSEQAATMTADQPAPIDVDL